MTEKLDEARKADQGPVHYCDARDDLPMSARMELVVAGVVTAVIWLAAVPAMLAFAFSMDYRDPLPSGTTGITIAFTTWAIMILAMVLLTTQWRRPDRRHRAFGIWIGFGVAGLIVGSCFAAMR